MKKIRIIALLAALVAFASSFLILSKSNNSNDPDNAAIEVQRVKVVIAKQDIRPYTTITEQMIEIKEIVTEKAEEEYFKVLEDVVGQVAISDIFLGDVLTPKRIVKNEDVALGLAYKVEKGMRATTVQVNVEQAVAYMLKVGNYIDIIKPLEFSKLASGDSDDDDDDDDDDDGKATANRQKIPAAMALNSLLDSESPANAMVFHERVGTTYVYFAFQRLKILALDDRFFKAVGDSVTGNTYGTITLEVTPQQALQMSLLKNVDGGKNFDVVLRNQYDEELLNMPRQDYLQPYEESTTDDTADTSTASTDEP